MSISKNPPQCHKHTSPWDSTLIISFLGLCKQRLPLFVRSQWQTKVHSTRVCPGEPISLLGCHTERGWESTYRSISDPKSACTGQSSTQYGWQLFHDCIDGLPSVNFPSLCILASSKTPFWKSLSAVMAKLLTNGWAVQERISDKGTVTPSTLFERTRQSAGSLVIISCKQPPVSVNGCHVFWRAFLYNTVGGRRVMPWDCDRRREES